MAVANPHVVDLPSNETITSRVTGPYGKEESQAVTPERSWSELLEIPAHLEPAVAQVFELRTLRRDWNSYGAPPVAPQAILQALGFLSSLRGSRIKSPAVAPTARGGVQFAWGADERSVEIDISPSGSLSVLIDDLGNYQEGHVARETSYDELLNRALALAADF